MSFMPASPQYAEDCLPSLPSHLQSDTQLTAHLASRFHAQLPTVRLSSHAIVSINTYTSSSRGLNGREQGSAMAAAKEMASRAWMRLGRREENQAVVFLGESGSGKTTLRAHVLSAILSYSSTPLSQKLSYAAFLFDTLTTTKCATTATASKAGLFFELQYDTSSATHPTLVGGKILDHRLERSRVSSVPTGERNFHVLYYLLAGVSPAEKAHLGLDHPGHSSGDAGRRSLAGKKWRYLGNPTMLKAGVDDAEGFQQFKNALRKLEFPRSEIAEICQILACILHLGQLEFHTSQSTTPKADESGGYSHEGGEDKTTVKNVDTLEIIAAFLGVAAHDLEASLGYKTRTLLRERVTVMLDPAGAEANADELARTIYSLLVAWIMESINSRTCAVEDTIANTISIVDFPGFAPQSSSGNALDQLLNNTATESLYNICLQDFFERQSAMYESEDVGIRPTSYFDNSDTLKGLIKPNNGLLTILDDQARRGRSDTKFLEVLKKRFENRTPSITVGSSTTMLPGSNFPTHNAAASFSVKHFAGEVEYPVDGLMEANAEIISGDMLNLIAATRSDFVRELFGQDALSKTVHPDEKTAVIQASVASKPMRQPSMARKKHDRLARANLKGSVEVDLMSDGEGRTNTMGLRGLGVEVGEQGVAGQFLSSLQSITSAITAPQTNSYFVFCLKSNDRRIANQFDSKCVRSQIQTLGIAEISQRLRNADLGIFMPFGEFLSHTEGDAIFIGNDREKAANVLDEKQWPESEAAVGATGVLLSERCWQEVVQLPSNLSMPSGGRRHADIGGGAVDGNGGRLTPGFGDSKSRLFGSADPSPGAHYTDDKTGSYFGGRGMDAKSDAGVSAINGDMFRNLETREQMAEKGNEKKMQVVDEHPASGSRKRWVFIVYLMTFYIPDFVIGWLGKDKKRRKDVRMAWREKLAINICIWLSCALVIFFMIGFPALICPKQDIFSSAELTSFNGKNHKSQYTAIRGIVYDLGRFIPHHYPGTNIIPAKNFDKYAGTDATNIFPVQVNALCNGKDGTIDPAVQLNYKSSNYSGQTLTVSSTDLNAKYHDFRWFTNDSRPDWWWEQQNMLKHNYMKGYIGFPPNYIKSLASKASAIAYMNGRVYDMTEYIAGGRAPKYPAGQQPPSTVPDSNFMDDRIVQLFQQLSGGDITKYWEALDIDSALKSRMKVCLDNLFFVGHVDTRNSTQCLFATYILLAISILLVSVIGFKFLAALQFGKKNMPENLDKFIICTVPAYTEDEESLRRAIDSAARMRYDDKRKLLVIICDGMILGQGNDLPTSRIVLDILGVSESVNPEALSYEALGEGMRQHNMGKVYSGLYEVQGHIVPFMVIVKVGRPSEVQKAGNRGKRDSQMILMRFLNRVHYNLPMTPMELEMHHQIRNIIGVNPTFYEFLFQIDADTVVAPDSATRMVSAFIHDTRLIGVCGETALTNAKSSLVTMMQVYEYYISHNLTKAFESLFGSVTCLPGCFSMYRIRAAETGKPLFISKDVVEAYSVVRVDTLHMKNLLHLGEDRYLTTLLIKFHSKYRTKYIFRAHAWTIAPDSWSIFLSQRRRWINSTVHNLVELIPIQQLCGFCCFSMRFVVFLDLLSTIVQPVIVGYIAYLIYLVISNSDVVPVTAFILLGAIYGLQAIIFILRRKWEMIGWMVIYVLATPVFACGLPLYAFWNMDDFSWGNTRIITGEKGQTVIVSDEGKFDPASIPRKRWEDYQAELWDAQTQRDDRSEVSGISYATKSAYYMGGHKSPHLGAYNGSEYGDLTPGSRPVSQLDLLRYGSRLSLAPSQSMAGNGMGEMEMSEFAANMPGDDALLAEIRDILSGADLMSITKKGMRAELERRFGVGLESKKAYISSATEAVLNGML